MDSEKKWTSAVEGEIIKLPLPFLDRRLDANPCRVREEVQSVSYDHASRLHSEEPSRRKRRTIAIQHWTRCTQTAESPRVHEARIIIIGRSVNFVGRLPAAKTWTKANMAALAWRIFRYISRVACFVPLATVTSRPAFTRYTMYHIIRGSDQWWGPSLQTRRSHIDAENITSSRNSLGLPLETKQERKKKMERDR